MFVTRFLVILYAIILFTVQSHPYIRIKTRVFVFTLQEKFGQPPLCVVFYTFKWCEGGEAMCIFIGAFQTVKISNFFQIFISLQHDGVDLKLFVFP